MYICFLGESFALRDCFRFTDKSAMIQERTYSPDSRLREQRLKNLFSIWRQSPAIFVKRFKRNQHFFQFDWHYDSVWLALCFSLTGIMIQFDWHYDSVWLALCFSLSDIMFQVDWHYVSVWLELCFSLTGIMIQFD